MLKLLVEAFFARIWNEGDLDAAHDLLSKNFSFRGSLGIEVTGIEDFRKYVCSVRGALDCYQCEILDCIAEQNKVFARMRFSGIHTGTFCGYRPTGKPVHWLGAALFTFDGELITELWVLGDLAGLDALLHANT